MNKSFFLKNNKSKCNIIIKSNYIRNYLNKLITKKRKVFCIVDINVKYLVKEFLEIDNCIIIFIKANENIKNIKVYNKICEKLLIKKIDRNSIIVAIGSGTVGDLVGFVASTLLRGIEFILIPTTLLAQVDSSIGGKNGINTPFGKNLIGTFKQPNEVVIDTDVLRTLSKREIKSGYSEIIKHAIIKDFKFFKWLDKNYKNIFKLNNKILREAISNSIEIKLWYVKRDSKEELISDDSRAMLNFGHTIGHALETNYKYSNKLNHGEAISIGMITEAKISQKFGYLNDKNLELILSHFKKTNLKIFDPQIKNNKTIDILLNDKKNSNNQINIVLLRRIGSSFFKRNIDIKKIRDIINQI